MPVAGVNAIAWSFITWQQVIDTIDHKLKSGREGETSSKMKSKLVHLAEIEGNRLQ